MEEAGSATRLGAIVRRRRLELGMTQEQLALSAGVSPKSIVTLETGRAAGVRLDKLRAVLGALGMSLFVGARPKRHSTSYEQLYASLVPEGGDDGEG